MYHVTLAVSMLCEHENHKIRTQLRGKSLRKREGDVYVGFEEPNAPRLLQKVMYASRLALVIAT